MTGASLHRLVACALAPGLLLAPASLQAETVRIGVRMDTPPFVWRDSETGNYLGFLWDVCTEAVQRAGYDSVTTHEVTAETRSEFLRSGAGGFDLLCDPTTITQERMRRFLDPDGAPELEFTPIIFVANASFVSRIPRRTPLVGEEALNLPACQVLIKRAEDSADNGNDAIAASANVAAAPERWRFSFSLRPETPTRPPEQDYQISGFVGGSTIGDTLEQRLPPQDGAEGAPRVCVVPKRTHEEAAEAFCKGQLDRYYGDIELVRAAIANHVKRTGETCDYRPDDKAAIYYEPYALVVSSRLNDFPEKITLALYSMFGDGTVERLLAGHFPEMPKSGYLTTLFQVNSIPMGATDAGRDPPADQLAEATP